MISEETFAKEEARIGKQVHFHDGMWWVKSAPFYCKPVHAFRPFAPGDARPHALKAFMGYSHQVPALSQSTRVLRWNVIRGNDLIYFSLQRLKSKRRNMVRSGIRDCRVKEVGQVEALLEQMRLINISQARRFESAGESGTFLPEDYYDRHAAKWREDMLKVFSHKGHQFVGAFVGEHLAAYVDLIQIEDTWIFGAVKSSDEYLKHRPVDALYFTILGMATQSKECNRVVNGGGYDERASLTRFKGEYLLKPVEVPIYGRTIVPRETMNTVMRLLGRRPKGHHVTRTKKAS